MEAHNFLQQQSPLNPPFTQGGTVWGTPPIQKKTRCGYPLYTRRTCPLIAHITFLLISKSLLLNLRIVRGFLYTNKKSPRKRGLWCIRRGSNPNRRRRRPLWYPIPPRVHDICVKIIAAWRENKFTCLWNETGKGTFALISVTGKT